ncbi:MAG: fatty acid hydroxylase family protein, partial [Sphingomonadaceae bacterium]
MKSSQTLRGAFWRRSHHLDKMTLRELVIAYFQYPAIIAYLVLAVVSGLLWFRYPAPLLDTAAAVAAAVMVYP